jgi:hypothetical protein
MLCVEAAFEKEQITRINKGKLANIVAAAAKS